MHVINGDAQFRVSTDSDQDSFVHAYRVFSACCEQMVFGFGDAKSAMLYNLIESCDSTATMKFKHQGHSVVIKVEVSG
jgi:hypothetical protein